jgi:hypothetical protein
MGNDYYVCERLCETRSVAGEIFGYYVVTQDLTVTTTCRDAE